MFILSGLFPALRFHDLLSLFVVLFSVVIVILFFLPGLLKQCLQNKQFSGDGGSLCQLFPGGGVLFTVFPLQSRHLRFKRG